MRQLLPALATTRVPTACGADAQAPAAGAAFMLEHTRIGGDLAGALP